MAEPDDTETLDDLDDVVRRGDPDRWLASRLIEDAQARADVVALLAFDLELARAPRRASNALVGEIRLTWWREALDEIFGDGPVRRHPTALALADVVARHGLPRQALEDLIDARYVELDKRLLDPEELADWVVKTAGVVAVLQARILDPASPSRRVAHGAGLWAVAQALRVGLADALSAKAATEHVTARYRQEKPTSTRAFPAEAVGALAPAIRRGANLSDFGKRARLLWSALRGRI